MKGTLGILLAIAWIAQAKSDDIQGCQGRFYEIPAGISLVCSATWVFDGPCDGKDLWDRWKVEGQTKPNEPWIRPWANERIVVIGYEMTKVSGDPHNFFMIGSGIQPDGFLWMAPDRNNARILFPAGVGHPWPTKQESEAQRGTYNDIIDIHGSCAPAVQPVQLPQPSTGFLDRVRAYFVSPKNRTEVQPQRPPTQPGPAKIFLTIYYSPWSRQTK